MKSDYEDLLDIMQSDIISSVNGEAEGWTNCKNWIPRTGYPELDTHFDHAVVSRTKLILIHILYRVSRIIMWAKQNSYPFLDILQVKILTVHMV
jgi:hypothetical protein